MSNNERNANERHRILEMVENGTISADEATKMLSALDESDLKQVPPAKNRGKKWIHIEVLDGEDKVDLRLPFALISAVEGFIPESARKEMQEKGVNLSDITAMMQESGDGKIVEIEEDGGAYVAITVE